MSIKTAALIVLSSIALSACAHQGAQVSGPLLSPYDLSGYRPGPGAEKYTFTSCPEVDPVMHDLDFKMFYEDPPVNSRINPARYAEFQAKQRVIQAYAKKVGNVADAGLFLNNDAANQCAMHLLTEWARKGGMLGALSKDPKDKLARIQAGFVQKWVLGELANSYLKIRNSKAIAEPDREAVVGWFRKLAASVKKVYLLKPTFTNNHASWAGVSLITAAIATNDHALFDFAVDKYKEGVDQIQDDGTLPQELARGTKALHYHNWTLTPLSIIARFAEANGVDVWSYRTERLDLLIGLLIPSLQDPDAFKSVNHLKPDRDFLDSDKGWAELIYRRTQDLRIGAYLEKGRPVEEYWFDWNMTAAFGG